MRGWAAELLADPRTWVVFAGLVLLALAATRPLANRTHWPIWITAGLLLSVAVAGTLTLAPAPGEPVGGPDLAAVPDCARALVDPRAWWRAVIATGDRGERVGNVLMFAPVGLFATLATRRPVAVAALAALAPAAVELGQVVLGAGRDCTAADWVNNATGAVLGAAGALALRWLAPAVRTWGGGGRGPASSRYASAAGPPRRGSPARPAATPPDAPPRDGPPGHTRDSGTS